MRGRDGKVEQTNLMMLRPRDLTRGTRRMAGHRCARVHVADFQRRSHNGRLIVELKDDELPPAKVDTSG